MEERIIKDINNLLTQLFQKIKEAGWEFDYEKKELKKIELKPAWSEEDEQNLNAALSYIKDEYLRRWLKDAIYNKYEKPAEWSEEDKEEFQIAIDTLVEAGQHDSANWLKSIKNRVHQKQGWSKEDEKIYQSIMDDTVQENQLDDKQTGWLKSIKQRMGG